MILLPGVLSRRSARRSNLIFGWHARDAVLGALTGQPGTLVQAGAGTLTSGSIVAAYGNTVVTGKAMPRFGRDPVAAANYLEIAGTVTGQDIERVSFPFAVRSQNLTLLVRALGTWSLGASNVVPGSVLALGSTTAGGGMVTLGRNADSWVVTRRTATTNTASVVEGAGWVGPLDLLVTYNAATGTAQLSIRDATGTIRATGAATTAAIAAGRFGGEVLWFGYDGVGALNAPPVRLYLVKLAPGLQTFAAMDALA